MSVNRRSVRRDRQCWRVVYGTRCCDL